MSRNKGRKVRCHITGEYGNSLDFIKIGQHYYKSQEIYDNHQKEMQYRKQIIDYITSQYLMLSPEEKFPTTLTAQLSKLSNYSYEQIWNIISYCDKAIMSALSKKHFDNIYAKLAYIFAIINNQKDKAIHEMHKIRSSKVDQSTYQEEWLSGYDNQVGSNIVHDTHDISRFLRGNEL